MRERENERDGDIMAQSSDLRSIHHHVYRRISGPSSPKVGPGPSERTLGVRSVNLIAT